MTSDSALAQITLALFILADIWLVMMGAAGQF